MSIDEELLEAVSWNEPQRVESLLQQGANPNYVNTIGATPLREVVRHKYIDILIKLLNDPKILVNAQCSLGGTALHLACYKRGYKEVANLLLKKGASPNLADNNGVTPLHEAARNGLADTAELLLQNQVNINALTNENGAPKNEREAEILSGYEIPAFFTPLHFAAMRGDLNMVRLLVAYGADTTIVTNYATCSWKDTKLGTARDIFLSLYPSRIKEFDTTVDEAVVESLNTSDSSSNESSKNNTQDTTSSNDKTYTHSMTSDAKDGTAEPNRFIDDKTEQSLLLIKPDDTLPSYNNEENNSFLQTLDKTEDANTIEQTLYKLYLAWIYKLPEWLKIQILNSTPVKQLIEIIKELDSYGFINKFVDRFANNTDNKVGEEYYIYEDYAKVQLEKTNLIEPNEQGHNYLNSDIINTISSETGIPDNINNQIILMMFVVPLQIHFNEGLNGLKALGTSMEGNTLNDNFHISADIIDIESQFINPIFTI